MALISISSDGQKLVGPLGLKKAEQDLIKRRYNYQYYPSLNNDIGGPITKSGLLPVNKESKLANPLQPHHYPDIRN